jgi:hypothetical protein
MMRDMGRVAVMHDTGVSSAMALAEIFKTQSSLWSRERPSFAAGGTSESCQLRTSYPSWHAWRGSRASFDSCHPCSPCRSGTMIRLKT